MRDTAVLQDPAGLLERIPGLRPLCADRWVRRAVAKGDPLRVYRALLLARLTGRLREHRDELREILRSRRAFARRPGRPYLGSWNGIGADLIGRAEPEPDGTRIATHVLELPFGIPAFPLGAYVVRPEKPSPMGERWTIFARVPLGPFAWAFRRATAVAAIAWLGAAVLGGCPAANRTVVVANGFGQPIHVTVGSTALDLAAGELADVSAPVGAPAARATTLDGAVLDEGPLDVRSERAVLVWNVAGAAPILSQEVRYPVGGPSETVRPPEIVSVDHCGERWLRFEAVEYPFVEPPRYIHVPPRLDAGVVVRRAVQLAERPGVDGALLCAWLALDHGQDWARAAAILERRARAAGWDRDAVEKAAWAARHVGAEDERRILDAARAARAGEVDEEPVTPGP